MSTASSPQLIERNLLQRASADLKRIEAEVKLFDKDSDAYIERRFTELQLWDFPIWSAINATISDKLGRAIRLLFNRVQRRLWEYALEDLSAGRPIRWFVIKGRQQGVSTWILCFFLWLVTLRPNRNAIVLTQDMPSVQNFSSRVESIYDLMHPLLKPAYKKKNRDLLHLATSGKQSRDRNVGMDSRIFFQPAKRPGLGQSYTIHYAHVSEICFYESMKPPINVMEKMVSLGQAIPLSPGSVVILESTPNGRNKSAEIWNEAVEGTNGFRAIFIPWCADDSYRIPIRDGEIFELCETDEMSGQPTRYGNERRLSKLLKEHLKDWYEEEYSRWGDSWLEREILARLKWRRQMIDEKCNGDKKEFKRWYPTTAEEGFEATGKNVFDLGSLSVMRKTVEEEGIQPRRFSYIHDPENENPDEKFSPDPYGALIVYEPPQPDGLYVLSGDPSMGIPNGDPSAVIVLKVSGDMLEEVASYYQIITPDQLAELVYYLGKLYNDCLEGIENNERGGFAVNLKLYRELKYPNLYFRYDAYDKKAAGQPGFVTKSTNKSILVTGLAMRIRDHEILLRTPLLLDQLEHYVDLGDGELGGAPGFNDDLVSAALIATHLSTKIHEHVPSNDPPPGSIGWEMKRGFKGSRKTLRRR